MVPCPCLGRGFRRDHEPEPSARLGWVLHKHRGQESLLQRRVVSTRGVLRRQALFRRAAHRQSRRLVVLQHFRHQAWRSIVIDDARRVFQWHAVAGAVFVAAVLQRLRVLLPCTLPFRVSSSSSSVSSSVSSYVSSYVSSVSSVSSSTPFPPEPKVARAAFPRRLWIGVALKHPCEEPRVHGLHRRRALRGAARGRRRPEPPQVAVELRVDAGRRGPPFPRAAPRAAVRHQCATRRAIIRSAFS